MALVAHRSLAVAATATAPAMAPSSGGLHDGGAVLHRRGCGWLRVSGQHRAGLVRGIALSKCRVHSPRWAARGTGGGRACQGQGKWLHWGARGHHRTAGRARGSLEGPAPPCLWWLPTLSQAQAHALSPGQGSWGVAEAGVGASILGTWL